MKAALIGATGYVGTQILTEALTRPQLEITAVVRRPEALPAHERLTSAGWSISDPDALAEVLARHDAVIHAFHPGRDLKPEDHERNLEGHRTIIDATKQAGVPRLLAVGGAASLMTAEGVEYLHSTIWDKSYDPYMPSILNTRALYYMLKDEADVDWVVIAPSSLLRPDKRTTSFRYGKNDLLFDEHGNSRISLEDYAYAMIEELLHPRHHRERCTVGY